jgi:hypothetical protein
MLSGLSLERVREVCHMVWGGQTVLSGNAWVRVQTTLPVGLQVSPRNKCTNLPHVRGVRVQLSKASIVQEGLGGRRKRRRELITPTRIPLCPIRTKQISVTTKRFLGALRRTTLHADSVCGRLASSR